MKSGVNGEDCLRARGTQKSQPEAVISTNFTEENNPAWEKVFEGKIRLKEGITEWALQRNGLPSDPSW